MPSQYAALGDLTVYGMPATALGNLTTTQQTDALIAASSEMDSYFRGRYSLPFTAWGVEVTECCCKIAAYHLLNIRGYNPASGADVNILNRYTAALMWLREVQRQAAHPDVTPGSGAVPSYNQPLVISYSVIDVQSGARAPSRVW
jgi:phage gp36-like protein